MTTYSSYADKTLSEKILLCWVEPVERLLIWTLDSGAIYTRITSHFVVDILDGTTSLTEASSAALNAGEWYYDSETSICYVRMSDDSNPNTKDIVGKYRKFYSTAPVDLPYDLSSGADVHYEGCVKSIGDITKQLDYEQTGLALESNTKLSLDNTGGIFDDIYDTLFWENKTVTIYSWNQEILLSEKQLLFTGVIQDKAYSNKAVSFKCKDFIYDLRQPLSMTLFSSGDGTVADTYLDTPKRRIFGKADNVKCIPVDNILEGYTLTGTIAGSVGGSTLTGTGTAFLDEVSPADKISITVNSITYEFDVETVSSDTSLVINSDIEIDFTGQTATNTPIRPWRKKNRNWSIAGHKLRAPSTTVDTATEANRFDVVDGSDLFDGDIIEVDGESATIKRIVGNSIVLEQNLQGGTPSGGDTVTKNPVTKAYFGGSEIFVDRDYTVTNTTEAILNITNTAERDIAPTRVMGGTITFTNNDRQVTATGIDLVNEVQPRDWIRSSDVAHTTWYEVLSVAESTIYLRTVYGGGNKADTAAEKKNVNLIDDEALITVNCTGLDDSGNWIKTASDAVKYILETDIGITNTNAASFTTADTEAPFILSMVMPEVVGGEIPKAREVITKINESVFGSLVNNSSWELVYNILTPEKPSDLVALEDHDVVADVKINSRNQIVKTVNAHYRPFVDRFTGEDAFKFYSYDNDFVINYIGSKEEKEVTLYLYDTADAQQIAQRYALYNSLSQSVVSVKAKLNLMLKNLGDKLYVKFDRLYKRFGGLDRKKIGIITKISKNGADTSVELADLGNSFNRVPSVADNTSADFTSADEDEKLLNGYVLDNSLEVPDTSDDQFLGTSIIG